MRLHEFSLGTPDYENKEQQLNEVVEIRTYFSALSSNTFSIGSWSPSFSARLPLPLPAGSNISAAGEEDVPEGSNDANICLVFSQFSARVPQAMKCIYESSPRPAIVSGETTIKTQMVTMAKPPSWSKPNDSKVRWPAPSSTWSTSRLQSPAHACSSADESLLVSAVGRLSQ